MRVRNYIARIVAGAKAKANQFIETELLGPADLDDSIQR
jgi:hypothetical protein